MSCQYSRSTSSTLLGVARGRNTDASEARITSRVGLGPTGHGGFTLGVSLDLHAPHLSANDAMELMARSHERWFLFQRHSRKHRRATHGGRGGNRYERGTNVVRQLNAVSGRRFPRLERWSLRSIVPICRRAPCLLHCKLRSCGVVDLFWCLHWSVRMSTRRCCGAQRSVAGRGSTPRARSNASCSCSVLKQRSSTVCCTAFTTGIPVLAS